MFQIALLLDLCTVVLLVLVVWNYLMEGNATVIEHAYTLVINFIPFTTAVLSIPVKVSKLIQT